jgi:hypothetical protein
MKCLNFVLFQYINRTELLSSWMQKTTCLLLLHLLLMRGSLDVTYFTRTKRYNISNVFNESQYMQYLYRYGCFSQYFNFYLYRFHCSNIYESVHLPNLINQMYLKHNSIGDDIPIVVVLKALGLESDQEIVQFVGIEQEILDMFAGSLEESYVLGIKSQQQVLKHFNKIN